MPVNKQLKQIRIIFYAILIGLLVFCAGSVALVTQRGGLMLLSPVQMQYLQTVIIILAFTGIPAAHLFHKRKTEHLRPDMMPEMKLSRYRVSFFIKMATFEGISLVSLLCYLMSAGSNFLIIFGILMVTILVNYPGRDRIWTELGLNDDNVETE
ncbi:hypothetical protein [Breznakibacter xylanolyticus]|uniref:hypothetical protein n=1 Tax=Breznakibacter xylanolyticus TaxID=990 RepID=UPI0011B4C256|nr:hypothetical protein [Breznakibacter xylanolyticus]